MYHPFHVQIIPLLHVYIYHLCTHVCSSNFTTRIISHVHACRFVLLNFTLNVYLHITAHNTHYNVTQKGFLYCGWCTMVCLAARAVSSALPGGPAIPMGPGTPTPGPPGGPGRPFRPGGRRRRVQVCPRRGCV